jgi:MFS family permease
MRSRRRRMTSGDGPAIIVAAIGGFCSPFLVHALGMGETAWRWPAAVVIGVLLAGITWLVLRWRDRADRRRDGDGRPGSAPQGRPREDEEPPSSPP